MLRPNEHEGPPEKAAEALGQEGLVSTCVCGVAERACRICVASTRGPAPKSEKTQSGNCPGPPGIVRERSRGTKDSQARSEAYLRTFNKAFTAKPGYRPSLCRRAIRLLNIRTDRRQKRTRHYPIELGILLGQDLLMKCAYSNPSERQMAEGRA
jgi:hypothetical protein